ncbi:sulfurtransferase [Solibacillus sp. R5-41]|uniref:rhodanese-like domain-containing protein n=1 Tax=Solibacillus sp. R5-41 TaxID=2048654 RepID=UPI000C1253F2|nr:rhodanese-like domain-containing protein [Solibacillus sp. R5-41]ATP40746.1 sulfurtransferase [Solibacillus sp. R5-41]
MKKWLVGFVAIITVFALTACSSDEKEGYSTIQIDEVAQKMEEGYIVLDVREVNEFAEGHIPGAQNKSLSALQANDYSELSKDENYIIICRSGNRSQTASDILQIEGYSIVNVAQGMSSWTGDVEK